MEMRAVRIIYYPLKLLGLLIVHLAIQAPYVPPPIHPADRDLLRPLKSLGQPRTETAGVSFLRRTQYTADDAGRRGIDPSSARHVAKENARKRKAADASKDEPVNILRSIVKSFNIAHPEDAYNGPDTTENIAAAPITAAEADAWKNPVHPTKPKLKLLDSYPILPDLNAMTDAGGYMVLKFGGNPANATNKYDDRMDVALLRPIEPAAAVLNEHAEKVAAHQADPENIPHPGPPKFDYEFFLPEDRDSVDNIKRKFDPHDPDKDEQSLYTCHSRTTYEHSFRYLHQRVYETSLQNVHIEHSYEEVALGLYDPDLERQMAGINVEDNPTGDNLTHSQKGAYYSPITIAVQLKAKRSKHLAQLASANAAGMYAEEDVNKVDVVDVVVGDPDETESDRRKVFRLEIDPDEERAQGEEG